MQSLDEMEATLGSVRPYIRIINSSQYIEALANGDLCLAVGYNGDVLQALALPFAAACAAR